MTDSSRSGISRRALLQALLAHAAGGAAWAQARVHAKPRPLAKDAVTHEWASFLGPTHNAVSTETRLSRTLPPALVWEYPKGTSYAAPAVAGGHVVLVHRVGEEEIVESLQPETGMRQWNFRYSTDFEDRYGYNNGPRSSPVIDGDRVFTVGAQGQLHCLDLRSGALVWRRNIGADYKVPQDFFGTASTPLVEDKLLIVNVGAPGGPCVVGLDKTTGREVWRAGKEWGPSYASPIPAVVHGRRRVFVFAGGESTPPTGGLLSIDPSNGRVDFVFPWRSRSYESVNASCPVIFDNKVFISASYRTGGALLEILPDFSHRVAVDHPGVRAPLEHADLSQRLSLWVRRTQRAGRIAGVRRRGERQGRVARDAGVERGHLIGRPGTPPARQHVSRIAARGGWSLLMPG